MGLRSGSFRIRHREYFGIAACNSLFTTQSWSVNPGDQSMFRWLSGVARNFETYKFNSLSFQFVSYVGSNSNGRMILAFDPDAADSAPPDEPSMFNNKLSSAGSCWTGFNLICHRSDISKVMRERYIRQGSAPPPNTDVKTYDCGVFYQGSIGGSGTNVGELYVSYDVTLFTPQAFNDADHATGGSIVSSSATLGASTPWGSANTWTVQNPSNYTFSLSPTSNTTMQISGITPNLNVLVVCGWSGTGITAFTPSYNATVSRNYNAFTTTSAVCYATLYPAGSGGTYVVTVQATFTATTITAMTMYCILMPSGFGLVKQQDDVAHLTSQLEDLRLAFSQFNALKAENDQLKRAHSILPRTILYPYPEDEEEVLPSTSRSPSRSRQN
jgi:hypothetical protein